MLASCSCSIALPISHFPFQGKIFAQNKNSVSENPQTSQGRQVGLQLKLREVMCLAGLEGPTKPLPDPLGALDSAVSSSKVSSWYRTG